MVKSYDKPVNMWKMHFHAAQRKTIQNFHYRYSVIDQNEIWNFLEGSWSPPSIWKFNAYVSSSLVLKTWKLQEHACKKHRFTATFFAAWFEAISPKVYIVNLFGVFRQTCLETSSSPVKGCKFWPMLGIL